jgi:hypothetical protein
MFVDPSRARNDRAGSAFCGRFITARYAMKKVEAARQPFAAAFALFALLLAVAVDVTTAARADTGEPDFLVLDPEKGIRA